MPEYPQLALFGGYAEPTEVVMPNLPPHPRWHQYNPNVSDRCDYCLMVEREQSPGRSAPVRRPRWARTGTDGALLLLCDAHAEMLLAEGGR